MTFDFNPSFWFICRLCKQAFQNTDQLKDHKLENHLGDCLRIKSIIFEEKFCDYRWCPNQDFNSESSPETNSNNKDTTLPFYPNPCVSINQLTPKQVGSALRKNSTLKNGSGSSPSKRRKRHSSSITSNESHSTTKSHQRQVESNGIQQEELPLAEFVIPKEEQDENLITEVKSEIEAPIPLFLNSDETHRDDTFVSQVEEKFTGANFETFVDDSEIVQFRSSKLHDVDSSADLNSGEDQFPDPLQEREMYSLKTEYEDTSDDPLSLEEKETVRHTNKKSMEPQQKPVFPLPRPAECEPQSEPLRAKSTRVKINNGKAKKSKTERKIVQRNSKAARKARRSFSCTMCDKSFKTNASLKSHILSHISVKPWKCTYDETICQATFRDKSNLRKHMKIHQNFRGYKCEFPECGKAFRDSSTLRAHSRRDEEKLCATTCGDLPCIHKEAAAKIAQKFHCSECRLSFKSKATQENHMINVHGKETDFRCRFCGKCFVHKAVLEVHERVHGGELPFKCEVANCGSAFGTKPQLDTHLNTKHVVELGLGKFLCQLCGKPFGYERFLKDHIKFQHENYRPFKCTFDDSCPKKFRKKWEMIEHVRAEHTGEMPFQCDKCGKSFAKKLPFEDHLKFHEGHAPRTFFSCTLCPRKFRERKRFQAHTKSHERGESFSCRFCEYQTCHKPALTTHERSHMKKNDEDRTDLDSF